MWVLAEVAGAVTSAEGATRVEATFAAVPPVAFGLAFLLGLAATFAPSSLATAPAVMGTMLEGRTHSSGRALALAGVFVGGVLLVDAAVGAVFAAVGGRRDRVARCTAGDLVPVDASGPGRARAGHARRAALVTAELRPQLRGPIASAAFAAGVPFGLLACPSCTPLLPAVLLGAVTTGDPLHGAAILAGPGPGPGRGLPPVTAGPSAGATTNRPGVTVSAVPSTRR